MPGMARKKKPVRSVYQDRHTMPRAVFHLPQELLNLIDSRAEENDRTRTAEIVRALKGYYQGLGLWPLPGSQDTSAGNPSP
jgi:hypothetical protein